MFSTRVTPGLLMARINSEAYAPVHTAAEAQLRSSGLTVSSLGDVVDKPINNSIRNVAAELDAPGATVPMFRPADMSDGWLSIESAPRLRVDFERTHAKARVYPGDLALGIAGTVGEVGRVPSSTTHGNINGSCARIAPKDSYKGYLHGFLRSRYGQSSLMRWAVGAVQKHINLEDLPGVLIAAPASEQARLYIGNKVRQAEALRTAASINRDTAHQAILGDSTFELEPSFSEAPRRIDATDVSDVSLDPSFVRATRGHRLVPSGLPLAEMANSCKCGEPIRADERQPGPYPYYGASGPIDVHDAYNFDGEFLVVAQDGSIGCVDVARGRFWGNNHVWVLSLGRGYDLDAVALYLRDYYPYWSGATTGSVVPKVTSKNLLRVCLPEAVAKEGAGIGPPWRRAVEQSAFAKRLTTAARFLVEALLERKVTEADLIAAHKSPEADRSLSERLTVDGLDAPGTEPLFTDLDRLEVLLNEAQAKETE